MMVGDSSVDIQTARNAHVKSCGVTYGFQPETLRNRTAGSAGGPHGRSGRLGHFCE